MQTREAPLIGTETGHREVAVLQRQLAAAQARIEALETLQAVTLWVNSELQLDTLLAEVLSAAMAVAGAEAGALLLLDESRAMLEYAVVPGDVGADLVGCKQPADEGAAGWTLANREPLVIDVPEAKLRFHSRLVDALRPQRATLACIPLTAKGQVVGALELLSSDPEYAFGDADIALLTAVAGQAAIAIENARLYLALSQERDRILAVEQEVRNQLARDLHDGPAQLLASLIMRLRLGLRLLDQGRSEARQELGALEPVLEQALREVRTMLFDLRPVILEARGLAAALEDYARRQRAEGFTVHFSARGEHRRLRADAERAVFAIVREAVANARRHSGADEAEITLVFGDGVVQLLVSDRGVGFDTRQAEADSLARGSLGLVNMRERTDAIGARLTIQSMPGEGATVSLTVPG